MHSLFRNAFFPKNKRGPVILKPARVTTFLPNILLSANIFKLKSIAISANSLNFFVPGLGLQVIWRKGAVGHSHGWREAFKLHRLFGLSSLSGSPLIFETQFLTLHHLAQVVQRVAHAAQGGVNAHVGNVGNFFKAHVAEVAHNQHFLLFCREQVN